MRMVFMRLLCGLLTCVAVLAVNAATNDDLLFYCNFDGSADATFSRGEGVAKCAVPPEFQPGVRGQAVVIGGSTAGVQRIVNDLPTNTLQELNCCYAPDKNLDVHQGSVAFWVKPLDWDGNTRGFNVLFYTHAGRNFFQIYKYFSDDQLLFLRGEQGKWTSVNNRIGDWKAGCWHHVVATWSPEELKMFVDGALICTRQVAHPFEKQGTMEPLSVGPGGAWAKAFTGKSLVDEFRIYSRPLGHEDVIRLYRHDSASVEPDADFIILGQRTPGMAGAPDPDAFEYAFACGQGFSNLKGVRARRQSRYLLSYDRSNLYVAVVSALDPARASQPVARDGDVTRCERVEVFLCPEHETNAMLRFAFTPGGGIYDAKNGDPTWNAADVRVTNTFSKTDPGWKGDPPLPANGCSNSVWILEAAIPFAALGLTSAPDGQRWQINIARAYTAPYEETSAAPVLGTLTDRSHFLFLRFRPDAPAAWVNGWMDAGVQSSNSASEIAFKFMVNNTEDHGLRSSSHMLFFKGQATPLRRGRPPVNLPPAPIKGSAFSLAESRLVEKIDGKETSLCRLRYINDTQLPLTTIFFYTQDRKRLFVSAKKGAPGAIQARFLRPDQTCALQLQQDIPTGSTYFNASFDLDFAALTPGAYTIKIDHVAPDGAVTESHEQDYRIPSENDPEFRPYVDVEADKVPAPWTPVEVRGQRSEVSGQQEKDGLSVSTWGRTYDFSKGFLFSSLVSQGRELLAEPAVLRLNGTNLAPVAPAVLNPVSATDVRAVLEKAVDVGPLAVSSRITTHFDGYCEVAMTLLPNGKDQELKSLSLDVPLRGDAATLVCGNDVIGNKNGALGDSWRQSLIKGPYFWIGNEKVGFSWVASSLENWHCLDNDKNVELIRQGGAAILRFNLVGAPLKMSGPRTITFGFTLTPSKPLDRKILRGRAGKDWQMWCQPWKYFATPYYDTADRAEIERAGKGVSEVFLYLSACFISPGHPNWGFWEEDWRQLGPGCQTYGHWSGSFSDKTLRDRNCYVSKPCLNADAYRNFVLNTWSEFFIKAKTPLTPKATGYYFDDWRQEGSCMNARHGCVPWKDAKGIDHTRFLVDANREMALNSYRMIKRTGPDAKIWQHVGWPRCVPTQQFADIYLGGECVPFVDKNYFAFFTPEMFRATLLPNTWGVKTVLLNMLVRIMSERHPDQYVNFSLKNQETRRALLHSYGYCIVHDVDIEDQPQTQPLRDTIWTAQDSLGWDERIVFHPYWEQGAVKLASPKSNRILASAYTKEGKMLLAILNDTDKEEIVRLELDVDKLDVKEGMKGHDVWEPESTWVFSKSLEAKMPPRGFRLILWDNK